MRSAFVIAICAGIASCCITSHSVKSAAPSPVSPSKLDGDGGAAALGFTVDGQCVRVVDGDTAICRVELEMPVRLLNCWAPESRGGTPETKAAGLKSKARLKELAEGKRIRLHVPMGHNLAESLTLGRVLGRVWVLSETTGFPERELSETMVSEGLATKEKP